MLIKSKYFLIFAVLWLSGCLGSGLEGKIADANHRAQMANLKQSNIKTQDFTIAAWARITQTNQPAHLYIEGDGLAWFRKNQPSSNPTPARPIALELAARDPAPNVIYLARPCQFAPLDIAGNACSVQDWTSHRYAPKIIDNMNAAISMLSTQYKLQAYHLIGFSGGANVAGLIAARRDDILSLRSVAGNIDNAAFTALHNISPMPESLNMADFKNALENLPQIHFIGGQDNIVPPSIAAQYIAKSINPACIQTQIIPHATHTDGWTENWPDLLRYPFRESCL